MYLSADLRTLPLAVSLGSKFDVVLIDAPLPEYERRAPGCLGAVGSAWSWSDISALDIPAVLSQQAFVFMWVGAAEGLDEGRTAFSKWGLRRCEDICWVKTNPGHPGNTKTLEEGAVLQHTMEHCLVGMRGHIKRATDGHFVQANMDVDLIVAEEV